MSVDTQVGALTRQTASERRRRARGGGQGGRGKLSLVAKAKRFVLSSFFLRRTKAHARASRSRPRNEKEHRLYYRVKDCGLRLSPPLPPLVSAMPARKPTGRFSARRSNCSLAVAALCASQSSVSLASAYSYNGGSGSNARNGNGYNSVSPWGPNSEQAMRQQQTQYANYGDNAAFYSDQMRDRGGPLANYDPRNANDASFGDNAAYGSNNDAMEGQRRIQGGSRRQYGAYGTRSRVHLSTDGGRPMDSRVQLWDGPDNTSHNVRVWSEDGTGRPMSVGMDRADRWGGAHGGHRNGSVDVRNRGPMEYPIRAGVSHRPPQQQQQQLYSPPSSSSYGRGGRQRAAAGGEKIQGGTVRHFTIDPSVSSVRVAIESDGTPIQALVELLQGPGRVAQLAEVYNQHGRAFEATLPTPGYGSTIAVRNEGPMEYPFYASVEPMSVEGRGGGGGGDGMGGGGGGNRYGDYVSGGNYGGGGYNGGYGYNNGDIAGSYGGYQYN